MITLHVVGTKLVYPLIWHPYFKKYVPPASSKVQVKQIKESALIELSKIAKPLQESYRGFLYSVCDHDLRDNSFNFAKRGKKLTGLKKLTEVVTVHAGSPFSFQPSVAEVLAQIKLPKNKKVWFTTDSGTRSELDGFHLGITTLYTK